MHNPLGIHKISLPHSNNTPRKQQCSHMEVFAHLLSTMMSLGRMGAPILLLQGKLDLWSITGCHADARDVSNWSIPPTFLYARRLFIRYTTTRWVLTTQVTKLTHHTQLFCKNKVRFEPIQSCRNILNFEGAKCIVSIKHCPYDRKNPQFTWVFTQQHNIVPMF